MKSKWTWILVLAAAAAGVVVYSGIARATPSSGFTGSTIASARFGNIEVMNHMEIPKDWQDKEWNEKAKGGSWFSLQKTHGQSDVYVQGNVWQPGGSTGWHTHPGHSLILVTAGAVTVYEGSDPGCKPSFYTAGMGFVDPGGDHVHLIRNEGTVEARTVAVQLIPADAQRRLDAPAPGTCPF